MSLFKKAPEVNQKTREIISHFLTTTNLESLEKSAIIFFIQSVSNSKIAKQNNKNKQLYIEFFIVTLELSGLSLDTYKSQSNLFNNNEYLLNITLQNLTINQKTALVILLNSLITFCQHNSDDWSDYKDSLLKIYKLIDTEVNLYELAAIELNKYIKSNI